jgi:NTE family protein
MKKKSFVLSGGGVRGCAHLGAVKALAEHNIFPSEIAGTSAGAIAGAFLANGFTPDEIIEMLVSRFSLHLLSWNSFKLGLISHKDIREFLEKNLRYTEFDKLPIPLHVTATSFVDGRQKIFAQGNVVDAVMAASSIPVLFPPTFIDDVPYVDGGLSNNLPVEPFADQKHNVVSIYVNPLKLFKLDTGVLELMDRSLHLSFREMVSRSAKDCFMYIEPEDLHKFGLFDINKMEEIFKIGYTYTKSMVKSL